MMKAAQRLPEDQLREVLNFIESLKCKTAHKTASQPPSGKALLELLLKEGLIEELPDLEAEEEPELLPISYTGKPFSETIIEDRGPK